MRDIRGYHVISLYYNISGVETALQQPYYS